MTTAIEPIFDHDQSFINLVRDWSNENLATAAVACGREMILRISHGDALGAATHARLLYRIERERERRAIWYRLQTVAGQMRRASWN